MGVDDEFDLGGHANAGHHLIAQCHRREKFAPAQAPLLGHRQGRRNHLYARVSIGQKIAFIKIQPGAGNAIEHGGIDSIGGFFKAHHPTRARAAKRHLLRRK